MFSAMFSLGLSDYVSYRENERNNKDGRLKALIQFAVVSV